mmetsp:Transcript_8396/g.22720  ORF Transcript_8396/g.22720 Transcript_8396/m.22720 type:complete len:221 (+) Transcript_8396:14-676(+)
MVFYFRPRLHGLPGASNDDWLIYMGRDKFENETLLANALPVDIWFHVDDLSSAHVYLRLPKDATVDAIPADTLEDCCQLVKANSIEGCKRTKVNIVYTPASNLKKTGNMVTGQVGYHDVKIVKEYRVEKSNEIVNRLNKTKQELFPDLEAEKNAWLEARTRERRDQAKEQKRREKAEREEAMRTKELLSYDRIMDSDDMVTNKELKEKYQSVEDWEDDFM